MLGPGGAVGPGQEDAATLARSLVTPELAPSEERKRQLAEEMKATSFDTPYGDPSAAVSLEFLGIS